MAPDPAPRGRRDNGLSASTFVSVGDVDPRVGEHLLDLLYLNGIAAYLQPTVDYDAVTRAASLPRQPTDRLWADRLRADDARALVAAEAASAGTAPAGAASAGVEPAGVEPAGVEPGARGVPSADPQPSTGTDPAALDEDAAWTEIVAFFHQESAAAVPPWPVSEDADEVAVDPDRSADGPPYNRRRGDVAAEPPTPEEERGEEEGYVPPPPPPLPRISKHTFGALLAVAFGLFMLLLGPRMLAVDPDAALKVGILAVISGVGYLIWRMHDGPTDDDRPDDGAVV